MAFLKVKMDIVEKESGSSYIHESGIASVNLEHCEVATTKNGATQVNYLCKEVKSYGNNVFGVDGKPTFRYNIMVALAAVLGEDGLSDPEPVSVKFKNQTKELMCIPELENVDVKAWIQFKYSKFEGKIQENVLIKRFYRASDNASGKEVLTGENIGEQYEKDLKYAGETEYDGVTKEEVEAWIKSKTGGNSGKGAATGGTATASAPAKKGFPGMG